MVRRVGISRSNATKSSFRSWARFTRLVRASRWSGVHTRTSFSCRHGRAAIGPRRTDKAVSPRYRAWTFTTWLNERHAMFAWASLAWVVITDVHIYLVARGIVRDVNTWG